MYIYNHVRTFINIIDDKVANLDESYLHYLHLNKLDHLQLNTGHLCRWCPSCCSPSASTTST